MIDNNRYNEKWKVYSRHERDQWKDWMRFEISNYGRVKKMRDGRSKHKDKPRILNPSIISGYPAISGIQCKDGKSRSFYIHHAVAELFLPPKQEGQTRIMKIDYDKTNNVYTNLKWVTFSEWRAHQPATAKKFRNAKLNESKVALLKKKLFDPNRKTRMKMLAKQFGISEMQVYRIKVGENWGHVEPAK